MKKILLLVVLLLLLAGGGGGAYWWFFLGGMGDIEAAEEEAPPAEPPVFVELDSLTVPVIRGGAVAKYILLKMTLEVADEAAREAVVERMPRLMDAYLRDLHQYFASVPVDSPLNVRIVKRRLLEISRRIAGAERVDDILIQGAFQKQG